MASAHRGGACDRVSLRYGLTRGVRSSARWRLDNTRGVRTPESSRPSACAVLLDPRAAAAGLQCSSAPTRGGVFQRGFRNQAG
jgi:hypothetical protein